MNTLTVNIDNKKVEKAIRATLEAFGLDYDLKPASDEVQADKEKEQRVIKDLKGAIVEIKKHREGKVQLQSAKDFLNEL